MREIIQQQDKDWEDWNLEERVKNMKRYEERNPLQNEWDWNYQDESNRQRHQNYRKEKLFMKHSIIIFTCCESGDHSTNKCIQLLDVASRGNILKMKGVCFNCTSVGHRVSQCKLKPCFRC